MLSVPTHVIESVAMTFSLCPGTRVIKTDLLFKFLSCRLSVFGTSFLPFAHLNPRSCFCYSSQGLLIQNDNTWLRESSPEQKWVEKKNYETGSNGSGRRRGTNYRSTLSIKIPNHLLLCYQLSISP